MTKFLEIDARIIATVQEAYLWLYDRTGVYVATVMTVFMFLAIGGLVLHDGKMDAFRVIVVLLNFGAIVPNYILQDKKNYTVFNMAAKFLQESYFRLGFVYLWLYPMAILDAFVLHWAWAMNAVCITIFMYLSCIMIREREPKDWFKKQQLAWDAT